MAEYWQLAPKYGSCSSVTLVGWNPTVSVGELIVLSAVVCFGPLLIYFLRISAFETVSSCWNRINGSQSFQGLLHGELGEESTSGQ